MATLSDVERLKLSHTYNLHEDRYYTVYTIWCGHEFESADLDAVAVKTLLPVLLQNALRLETEKPSKQQRPPTLDRIEDEAGNWVPSLFDSRNQECLDCGENTVHDLHEYYMVTTTIWEQVVPEQQGMICIGCFEKRLGRELTHADFMDVPVNHAPNWAAAHSDRLRDRLARR